MRLSMGLLAVVVCLGSVLARPAFSQGEEEGGLEQFHGHYEYDGRLPSRPSEPLAERGAIPEFSGLFRERNEGKFSIYWDFELDTPRYLRPHGEYVLFEPGVPITQNPEEYRLHLETAIAAFVDDHADFFGITAEDLVEPLVRDIGNLTLYSYRQAAGELIVRGGSFRILVDRRTNELVSVKSFLLRDAPRHDGAFAPLDAARSVILQQEGWKILSEEKELYFPRGTVESIEPVWRVKVEFPGGSMGEVFVDALDGEIREVRRFQFGLSLMTGRLLGYSPTVDKDHPNYLFTKPDEIELDAQPINGAHISGSISQATTDQSGVYDLAEEGPQTAVIWELETGACKEKRFLDVDGIGMDVCLTQINNFKRRVGVAKPSDEGICQSYTTLANENETIPDVLRTDSPADLVIGTPTSVYRSAQLLGFHHLARFDESFGEETEFLKSDARWRLGNVELLLEVHNKISSVVSYRPGSAISRICFPQRITVRSKNDTDSGARQWMTPTFLRHEYAHHAFFELTNVLQSVRTDCGAPPDGSLRPPFDADEACHRGVTSERFEHRFEHAMIEGVVDAMAAFQVDESRFGYYSEGNVPGPLAYDISKSGNDRIDVLRETVAQFLWRFYEGMQERATLQSGSEKTVEQFTRKLIYHWLANLESPEGAENTFEFSQVFFDELLVAMRNLFDELRFDRDSEEIVREGILASVREQYIEFSRAPFLRGDANQDGAHDITDSVIILYYLFLGTVNPNCLDSLDVDDTGTLDVSDAIFSLNYLFVGEPGGVPEPSSACGFDPTPDDPWVCFEFTGACSGK